MKLSRLFPATTITVLAACGGGGTSSNDTSSTPPITDQPACEETATATTAPARSVILRARSELSPMEQIMAERRTAQARENEPVTGFVVKYRDDTTGRAHIMSGDETHTRMRALNIAFEKEGHVFQHGRTLTTGHQLIELADPTNAPRGRVAADAVAKKMKDADPRIEYVDPDVQIKPMSLPIPAPVQFKIPDFTQGFSLSEEWFLNSINAPQAWAELDKLSPKVDLSKITIGIVDTGYIPHPDLTNKRALTVDAYAHDTNPYDEGDSSIGVQCKAGAPTGLEYNSQHGLKVEGILSANGAVKGVFPGVSIVQARYFGACGGSYSQYLEAINSLIDYRSPHGKPIDVLNMSNGGGGACPSGIQAAMTRAVNSGIIPVAAAGNDHTKPSNATFPSNCVGVIAAGASTRERNYTSYTATSADVYAPGGDDYGGTDSTGGIISTSHEAITGRIPMCSKATLYQSIAGTSFSTPMTAGAAALMRAFNPDITPQAVKDVLKATSTPPDSADKPFIIDSYRAAMVAKQLRGASGVVRAQPYAP